MNAVKYNEDGLLDRWNSLRWFQKTISIGLVSGYILGLTYIWVMHISFDLALLTIVLWSGGIIASVIGVWLSIFTWKHLVGTFITGLIGVIGLIWLIGLVVTCILGLGSDAVVDAPLFIVLWFGVVFFAFVCSVGCCMILTWLSSQKKTEMNENSILDLK